MEELLQAIRSSLTEFSFAQKRVAVFILENYKEIPFLSVTSMAKLIGVSDTTIIKFCMRMGFGGFGGFKKVVSEHVQSEVTMYGRLEDRLREIDENNTLDKVLAYDLANLQATLNHPHNRQNFDRFVAMIEQANNIYVLGFRTSAILAEYMVMHLRQQDRSIHAIIPGLGEYADKLCMARKGDLCIAVTFTRYSDDVRRGVRLLKDQGIDCALITDSVMCPCYPLADISLLCETKTFHHALSYVGYFSLINAVITATSLNRKSEATLHLKRLERMFSAFDTFCT